MIPDPVRVAIEQVVSLLTAGQFDDLERLDRGGRMKAHEWSRRIVEYGRILSMPPPGDVETAEVVQITGNDRAWSVSYRLWTVEEGRSDLGLELTVRYWGGDDVHVEVDDLRVS